MQCTTTCQLHHHQLCLCDMQKATNSLLCSVLCHAVFGYEIQKVDVYQERFIVARTQGTLMLGDLDSCKLSEIPWNSDLTERFYFDSDKVNTS